MMGFEDLENAVVAPDQMFKLSRANKDLNHKWQKVLEAGQAQLLVDEKGKLNKIDFVYNDEDLVMGKDWSFTTYHYVSHIVIGESLGSRERRHRAQQPRM
jgi:hypothetical protein